MKENFLHFLWKLQLFSFKNLFTVNNERIQIMNAGMLNENQGPDFLNAKIAIDEQVWAGNIELHVKSSDWYVHKHELDENYDSIILHVVWEHDIEIFRSSNQIIPTLELKNYVEKEVILKYQELFNSYRNWIHCENQLSFVSDFTLNHWKERLYFERLEEKTRFIKELLHKNHYDWEATLFILIAKNFGLKINGDGFSAMAKSINFSIVRKLSNNQKQLEALFFGQAGLLNGAFESNYFKEIKCEYEYLKSKFGLKESLNGMIHFFRLRPQNFPTIRLSQLACLYAKNSQLFSKIITVQKPQEIYKLFEVSTSEYWQNHYTFDKVSKKSTKKIATSFIELLIINTIVPLKFQYLKSMGKSDFSDVISLIEAIKPERNSVVSKFKNLTIKSRNAFDTQALLQLKNNYCNKKLCLECEIGISLLKT